MHFVLSPMNRFAVGEGGGRGCPHSSETHYLVPQLSHPVSALSVPFLCYGHLKRCPVSSRSL